MKIHLRSPLTLILILTITVSMLVETAQSMRVAVLGSGISGSTAARTLADRGIKVTVFEAGRGIGGRTSTRITRGDGRYQFDHGAQYIGKPKTEVFAQALDQWKNDGWVKDWKGNFATATVADLKLQIDLEVVKKERWVGYPAMHSICRNLLHHENIQVKLQTRANAHYNGNDNDNNNDNEDSNEDNNSKWELTHATKKKELGSFDWLIATDRNSGAHYRKDLSSAKDHVGEFRTGVRGIQSVKSLTAMVAFESSLGLHLDGIQFDPVSNENGNDNGTMFGSLGWAARDTSKPGRDRKDGQECWVLQSHPEAAEDILKELKRNNVKKIEDIRTKAKEVLVEDFIKSIPFLNENGNKDVKLPKVATAIGHRWGAAFPIPSPQYAEMDSQLIADKQFVACGDYFGPLSGRIEGAYLSGRSAADRLCLDLKLKE